MTDLVLASKSAIRETLLRRAGYQFDVVPAYVDEAAIRESWEGSLPRDLAAELSLLKAQQVSARLRETPFSATSGGDSHSHQSPGRLVVGADQILVFEEKVLGKSADMQALRRQLLAMAGKWHVLISAFQVVDAEGQRLVGDVVEARMKMRDFSPAWLDNYLQHCGEAILSSVGGYHYEGLGIHLFEVVEGEFTTILGLPMRSLVASLAGFIDPVLYPAATT